MVLIYVLIAIVVVAVIIGIVMATRQRSTRLQRQFGPEYQRTLQERGGNRSQAERELSGRLDRRKQLNIVPLDESVRQQYLSRWQQIQTSFVDAPANAVRAADVLVNEVMSARGYPMTEFEERAADISVDHPDIVENYRGAHAVTTGTAANSDTEALRVAFTHYRALFEKLLGEPAAATTGTAATAEPAAVSAANAGVAPQQATAPPPAPPPATS